MSDRKLILNINPDSNGTVRMHANANPKRKPYGSVSERVSFTAWRDQRIRWDEWHSISFDELIDWVLDNTDLDETVLNKLDNDQVIAELQSRSGIEPDDVFTDSQLHDWAVEHGYTQMD